jgi:tripartite-type tricarboxylate transporter receptor subunit TctC
MNSRALTAVLNTPEIQQRYLTQGMDPIPSTSAHYAAYLKAETEKWAKVVRAAKIPQQ